MTGKELQEAFIGEGRRHGWLVAHTPPVQAVVKGARGEDVKRWMTPIQADGKGFPDLLLVRERVVVVEVKGKGDAVRPEQSVWLSAFRMAGIETYVWTEADWPERVTEVLQARRPQALVPRHGVHAIEWAGQDQYGAAVCLGCGLPEERGHGDGCWVGFVVTGVRAA